MSGENELITSGGHYKPFEITEQGMGLRQTAIAGCDGKRVSVEFTRGAIGDGRPSTDTDVFFMTGLVSPVFDVPVKGSFAQGRNHVMSLVIENSKLTDDVLMTEMGIFARLVETGAEGELIEFSPEVLYGYTYTQKYDYIPAGGEFTLYREMMVDTVISRSEKTGVIYDWSKIYATAYDLANVQGLGQQALTTGQEALATATEALATATEALATAQTGGTSSNTRKEITYRIRNPLKPNYGIDGGEDAGEDIPIVLETAPYTGTAEVVINVGGTEFDVSISTDGENAPDGTAIIKKI